MPELAPHPHPDLGGYVLGALEPAERADFEEHLAGCERCQAEVAELRGLPELLEQAAPPVEGPLGCGSGPSRRWSGRPRNSGVGGACAWP